MTQAPPSTRLPAAERRQAIVEAALGVFSSRQLRAARRRPRSPARRASPSRSSTAISPRSASSTSPASTRPGRGCGAAGRGAHARARRGETRWPAVGQATAELCRTKLLLPNLWMQAITEAGRGRGDPPLPARPHARGARLRRRHRSAAARTRAAFPPSATPTPRRGSSSPAACSSRSPTGWAASSTGGLRRHPPRARPVAAPAGMTLVPAEPATTSEARRNVRPKRGAGRPEAGLAGREVQCRRDGTGDAGGGLRRREQGPRPERRGKCTKRPPAAAPGDVSNEAALAEVRRSETVTLRPSHVSDALRLIGRCAPRVRPGVRLRCCRALTIGIMLEEVK